MQTSTVALCVSHIYIMDIPNTAMAILNIFTQSLKLAEIYPVFCCSFVVFILSYFLFYVTTVACLSFLSAILNHQFILFLDLIARLPK